MQNTAFNRVDHICGDNNKCQLPFCKFNLILIKFTTITACVTLNIVIVR